MYRITRHAGLLALTVLPLALPALAQQAPDPANIELTALAGRQSGGDFNDQATGAPLRLHGADSTGLVLDVGLAPDIQLEFLYSRGKSELAADGGPPLTDVKVEYLHMGAAYLYATGHVRPFLAVTLGATRLQPMTGGYEDDTRFSLGIGGGVKLFLTRNIGVRLEARAFANQVDSDSAVFCNNGTCRIYYDGDFLMQYTANAGVVIAF